MTTLQYGRRKCSRARSLSEVWTLRARSNSCHCAWTPSHGLRRLDAITPKRYDCAMDDSKRATVYFDAEVHQALRLKAAAADRSISDVVNEAVRVALAEDAEDLTAFDKRKAERSVSFESFVRSLRQRGRRSEEHTS